MVKLYIGRSNKMRKQGAYIVTFEDGSKRIGLYYEEHPNEMVWQFLGFDYYEHEEFLDIKSIEWIAGQE